MYELKPIYHSKRSFVGEVIVKVEKEKSTEGVEINKYLWSGERLVAKVREVENDNGEFKGAEVYSVKPDMTLRHVREFLQQEGFEVNTEAQILRDFGVNSK